MNNYYIYIYLDPRKSGRYCYKDICFLYEPIYVGKGRSNRWKNLSERSDYFKKKINKIKKSRLEPIVIKLYENLSENQSFGLEKKLIQEIGRIDVNLGTLLNMTDGGEGFSGFVVTKEIRNKMSKNHANVKGKNNPMFGKQLSKEAKRKLSESKMGEKSSWFGKKHSEKSKFKMSKTRKEKFKNGELNLKGKNNPMFDIHLYGEKNGHHKLTNKEVIQIKMLFKLGFKNKDVAKIYNVHKSTISLIKLEKTWFCIKIQELIKYG